MIVDAHAHVFPRIRGFVAAGPTRGLKFGQIRVGKETVQLLPPFRERTVFTPDMLIAHMNWAGVDRAVLLQGPFYGQCNRYVADAVNRYPDRLVGAACFDPWDVNARTTFETEIRGQPFAAVKFECSMPAGLCGIHPGAQLGDPSLSWIWDQLERQGLALVLDLGAVGSASYQTDAVRTIAQEHGDLKIVIAHLAQPNLIVEADAFLWRLWEQQIDLAQLPNVWFDTASLPAYVSKEAFPYPSVTRYLRLAVDRVGPEKILWGTDVPSALTQATYPQLLELAHVHTQFLSTPERRMVLAENSRKVFCPPHPAKTKYQ